MGHVDQRELSVPQVAQVLGVSLGTVRRWSDLGYLESCRTERGQRRFRQEQIDRFIDLLERQHVDPLINRQTDWPAPLRGGGAVDQQRRTHAPLQARSR
jgi:excisionase family DNA binding protein